MAKVKGDIILILDIIFIVIFLIIGLTYLLKGYFTK
jgi:hypothetical protein